MKKTFFALSLSLLCISCSSDDIVETPMDSIPMKEPLTESLVELGVKYGPETQQFLDIYKAASDCPTPVYFNAHGNGGNTDLPSTMIDDLNTEGISVISWESLTSVNTIEEVEKGWSDAELMFQWVIDNAGTYNFDVSNLIIGGSSRGSILSWIYGHVPNPNIKGLYMYNALPSSVWGMPEWWSPTDNVTSASPPIYFVYRREPGSSLDPIDSDIHDPENGITIMNQYEDLGIGDRATLVHSISETDNTDRFQFLVEFALSVITTCP
ncbi:MAG: hypothetical protein AAF717_22900 [Bacteroidota bacterium]